MEEKREEVKAETSTMKWVKECRDECVKLKRRATRFGKKENQEEARSVEEERIKKGEILRRKIRQ